MFTFFTHRRPYSDPSLACIIEADEQQLTFDIMLITAVRFVLEFKFHKQTFCFRVFYLMLNHLHCITDSREACLSRNYENLYTKIKLCDLAVISNFKLRMYYRFHNACVKLLTDDPILRSFQGTKPTFLPAFSFHLTSLLGQAGPGSKRKQELSSS